MSAINSTTKAKTAVILLNMGGPQNKDEVHPYLKELFQDRELLDLPFQKILGNFIDNMIRNCFTIFISLK